MHTKGTSRREFLTLAVAAPAVAMLARGASAATTTTTAAPATAAAAEGAFTLPPLPYTADALEPHIDAQTMGIHHGKHHAAYVANLNKAVAGDSSLAGKTIEDLLKNLKSVTDSATQAAIRNNGGGHYNHTMFWDIMTPGGPADPSGDLVDAINAAFGGLEQMKEKFNEAGLKRFGSGWAWLVKGKGGTLEIVSTANQDCPLTDGQTPILGNDVWEHAYYLKYQNRRADYLAAWWNVVNWDKVAERLAKA